MATNVDFDVLTEAGNSFATNFTKTIFEDSQSNLITSPLSAFVILAQLAYGARGRTASQIRDALRIPSDDTRGQLAFQSLAESLSDVKHVDLHMANKIYVSRGFRLTPEFENMVTTRFLSWIQLLDFSSGSAAAQIINTWCETQTHGHIKEVVKPDSFGEGTKLVLVNAIYFRGNWLKPFHPDQTRNELFHIDETTVKDVPTMCMRHSFRTGALPEVDATFIEFPYEGDEFSMVIIYPNQVNGLNKVLAGVKNMELPQILERGIVADVDVYLPKFKVETEVDLEEVMRKMGISDIFADDLADLSGISDKKLSVTKFIQKAFIEVDEKGSEAAAFTMVGIALMSSDYVPPAAIHVDRPFKYMICRRSRGLYSLFDGVVRDPSI